MGRKGRNMPFGAKKQNPPAVVKAEEPAGGKEKGEATEKVGWSWGALAALEGVCQNINPNIYGEVTADGCAMMFKNLPPAARLDDDSVIYDLGSGYGKFSIWCGTVAKKRSVGIENNPSRAAAAEKAFKSAVDKGNLSAEEKNRITLKEGDAFAEGAFEDATHIYMCNVGYSEDMHLRLLEQVPKAKRLKIIMTITSLHDGERAVPAADLEKAGLTYEGFSPTPTTWDPAGEVTKTHYYCTAKGRELPPLKLKLVDAEKFSTLVTDVYTPILEGIREL